jgi:hypothetical protein
MIMKFLKTWLKFFFLSCLLFLSGCDVADSAGNEPTGVVVPAENQTARNFYVVFDGSGSMEGRAPNSDRFADKLAGAKWALHQFVEALPDDVQLGLYVFDGKGRREVLPLATNNKKAFLAAVDAVKAGGTTPLGASMGWAVKTLKRQYEAQMGYGEYRLLVVTDGEADDFGNVNSAGKLAGDYGFPLYTIGFGIGQRHSLRQFSLSYQDAQNADQLKAALQAAGSEAQIYDPADFKEAVGK